MKKLTTCFLCGLLVTLFSATANLEIKKELFTKNFVECLVPNPNNVTGRSIVAHRTRLTDIDFDGKLDLTFYIDEEYGPWSFYEGTIRAGYCGTLAEMKYALGIKYVYFSGTNSFLLDRMTLYSRIPIDKTIKVIGKKGLSQEGLYAVSAEQDKAGSTFIECAVCSNKEFLEVYDKTKKIKECKEETYDSKKCTDNMNKAHWEWVRRCLKGENPHKGVTCGNKKEDFESGTGAKDSTNSSKVGSDEAKP